MTNAKQRRKNRQAAQDLKQHIKDTSICPECGEPGAHLVVLPQSLFAVMNGEVPQQFWTCSKFYDPVTKRRIVP